jgi:hypothetical protein
MSAINKLPVICSIVETSIEYRPGVDTIDMLVMACIGKLYAKSLEKDPFAWHAWRFGCFRVNKDLVGWPDPKELVSDVVARYKPVNADDVTKVSLT